MRIEKNTKETSFSHIAMCGNASETPFLESKSYVSMC